MNSIYNPFIHGVRRFNRFYTNILGLLDQHMLDSEFSLAEARVLYEIGHTKNCTAKKLIEELKIDPGYLSRMIKGFEKKDLTYRVQSIQDGRLYYLYLTDKGKDTLAGLDELSDSQIEQIISSLPEQEQQRVAESMRSIEQALSQDPVRSGERVNIRRGLKPGDVGLLIHLDGWIYDQECGYNHGFEVYVCKTFYQFFENYSPDKDQFWFVEVNGKMVGAIAVVEHSPQKAQLRWFILHPQFRSRGFGHDLFTEAMQYCRERGYKKVFLETTADQKTAIKMYMKAGFRKVAEHKSKAWGKDLIEQTFELNLPI